MTINIEPLIVYNFSSYSAILNLMSDQTDNLIQLLTPYGLSNEEAQIYLHILHSGFTTALEISRIEHLARTKVYRILDKLKSSGLIEQKLSDRGLKFGATHPSKFSQLVEQQESRVQSLKSSLPELIHQLSDQLTKSVANNSSKVLYYQGLEGLKQVSYNLTQVRGDIIRVFEVSHLSEFLPANFSEDLRRKLVANQAFTRDLTNRPSFGNFTRVKDLVANYSEFRYISPKSLTINFETLIYNNVYATYSYRGSEIFCVEIYSHQLAEMQKQIYDVIWAQSTPMKFSSPFGSATI